MDTEEATPTGLDIAAASESIGAQLFPETPSQEAGPDEAPATTPPSVEAAASPPDAPKLREIPKTWPKEMHDYWGKTDPKVQEYWETREKQMLDGLDQYKADAQFAKSIRETLTPYQQTLKGLRVNEMEAIRSLFNADHQLRYSTAEQKRAHFEQLAKNYGVEWPANGTPASTTPVDPAIESIQQQLTYMRSLQQAQQQAALQEARSKADQEVAAFAADDKAHPYFNEIVDDITILLQANQKLSLQEAYEKAVWANPVTRAKEVAKVQTDTEAKLKENARLEALPKKKAAAVNVRSRDTQRSPTEPLGTMEDTLKATLAQIQARAS